MEALEIVLLFFAIVMVPFMIIEPYLLIIGQKYLKKPIKPPVVGRKIIVAITTKGSATSVVNEIINTIRGYNIPIKIVVIREEYDLNGYNSDETVIVPSSYETPNKSRYKPRALHYFSIWLKEHGYSLDTYVVHLDDDSTVSKKYIQYVLGMTAVAGQGSLRLRNYGYSLFSTLGDFGRSYSCDTYCAHSNAIGKPLGVHGEGLVIRADVEATIGWDFVPETLCSEDLLMGQSIAKKFGEFDYIPGGIYIAPPVTVGDFYKQRRRWMYSFFMSWNVARKINKKSTAFFTYMYSMGWAQAIGFVLWMGIMFSHLFVPLPLIIIFTIGLTLSFINMQYGVYKNHAGLKWHIIMLLLTIPVAIFQSGVFFYTLFTRPQQYDVIKKV